jgi:hypothetical protein
MSSSVSAATIPILLTTVLALSACKKQPPAPPAVAPVTPATAPAPAAANPEGAPSAQAPTAPALAEAPAPAAPEPPAPAAPSAPPPPPPPITTKAPSGPVLPCWEAGIEVGVSSCAVPNLCAAFFEVAPALDACFDAVAQDARLHVAMTLALQVGPEAPRLELVEELAGTPLGSCLGEAFGRVGPLKMTKAASCDVTIDPNATPVTTPSGDAETKRHRSLVTERSRLIALAARERAAAEAAEAKRLAAERKAEEAKARKEAARLAAEQKAEEARARKEAARLAAEQKAEEARIRREEARAEAERRAEEARERREEARAEARAKQCERCQAGIEACEERVKNQHRRRAEQLPLPCDGFLDCFAAGIADGAAESVDAIWTCEAQCDRWCD